MEYKDLENFEKQGKIIRIEIETLGTLVEKLEDVNTIIHFFSSIILV